MPSNQKGWNWAFRAVDQQGFRDHPCSPSLQNQERGSNTPTERVRLYSFSAWRRKSLATPPPVIAKKEFAQKEGALADSQHKARFLTFVRNDKRNFSKKGGTRPPSPREVNSRGSSPAVSGALRPPVCLHSSPDLLR